MVTINHFPSLKKEEMENFMVQLNQKKYQIL